jgi:hypothetical protein
MGRTCICRLCGKEGKLRAALINGNETYVLSHYCPVKAARKKEKKSKDDADMIAFYLRQGVDKIGLPSLLESMVWEKYPYKYSGDPFAPDEEDYLAFKEAHRKLRVAYLEFLKANMRYPNKREEKKIFKEAGV